MFNFDTFDQSFNITDRDDLKNTSEALLNKLDDMLDQYGLKHAFCLYMDQEIDKIIDKGQDPVIKLLYLEEQEVEVALVYALWCKQYRGADDSYILRAFAKKAKRAGIMIQEEV